MKAEYSMTVDVERNLLRCRLSGFFTPEDIAGLAAVQREAFRQLPGPDHVSLVDIRGMKIQTQAAVDTFQSILARPQRVSRRLAFVVSPTLARGQLLRIIATREEARCFAEPEEAEAWLLDWKSQAA